MNHAPTTSPRRRQRTVAAAAAAVVLATLGVGAVTATAEGMAPLRCESGKYAVSPLMAKANGDNIFLQHQRHRMFQVTRAELAATGQVVVEGPAAGERCTWVGPSGAEFHMWGRLR